MLKRTKTAIILTGFKHTERVIAHAEVQVVVPEPEVAADAEVRYDVNNRAKPEMAAEAEVHTENNCQTP